MSTTSENTCPRLRVSEIFLSLQGESLSQGLPTVFVRLTGCPLRCSYCDTEYAFSGGEWRELDEILAEVAEYQVAQVTVTGGEPLAQPNCPLLLTRLCDADHKVSLETSGALDIAEIDSRVVRVMDLKTPASGEEGRNLYANLAHLGRRDQVKFVIADRNDYRWARELIRDRNLNQRCPLLMLPVHQSLHPRQLAEWILQDRLPVRLQIQLHKSLWGDEKGR